MRSNGQSRVGLVCSGLASSGAAMVLLFKLVTPQAIAGLGTPELIGLLSLLAMPAAALWALRHAVQESPTAGPAQEVKRQEATPAPVRRPAAAAPFRRAA